jgi:hypothetical protein
MNNRWRAGGLIVCLLTLTILFGCMPRTNHPLPYAQVADERLLGEWIGISDGERISATVTRESPERLRISTISLGYEEGGGFSEDPLIVVAWTTKLQGEDYLTAQVVDPDDEDEFGFVICRYTISEDGEVAFSTMDEDAVAADIESGLVAGIVTRGKWIDDIILDAPPESLATYLTSADTDRIFAPPFATFRRIGD